MSWLRSATAGPPTTSVQPAGGQRGRVPLVGAMISVFMFSTCVPIQAGCLERIDNGNIELRAFDERLVLREKDSAQSFLDFKGNEKCDPKAFRTTLYRWLNDPVFGACLNRVVPDHDTSNGAEGLSIGITLKVEDGLIYPGGLRSDALPKSSLGFRMFEVRLHDSYPLGGVPFWENDRVWTPASGYERIGTDRSRFPGVYRLPATARSGLPARPLLVDCSTFTCGVNLHSPDGIAELYLTWQNDVYDAKTQTFGDPKPDWANYGAAARAIADAIFADKPKGDLQ